MLALKSMQNIINVFEILCYRTEECYASHGWNMSPVMRCLTRPTQSPHSLSDWLSYIVKNGGITFDLRIGRLHGKDREEDQEQPG